MLEFAEFLVLLGDIQYCKLFQPSDWQEILDTENFSTQLASTKKEAQNALDDKSPSQQKVDEKKAAYKAKVS